MDEDDELMRRLQNGEDTALNEVMTRWQARVIGFIYRYVGNSTDAADLAQETFVRLFEKRASYKTNGKFSSWLFTIATNLCRNFFRWQKRHPTVTLESREPGEKAVIDSLAAPQDSPDAAAERSDLANAVREQIHALPHDLKTAVLLFEYEQLSYAQIAAVLGCSAKAAETRLYRARKILHEKLSAWGD